MWVLPESGYKLNTDGSYNVSWITCLSARINVLKALHSELLAPVIGQKMVARQNLSNLQIETDSTEIVQVIHKGHDSYTNLKAAVSEAGEPKDQP
ncbi:hypothetical protein RDI58_000811 [Solanum bulbocastanum]|uniref:Uncharacterized protein n=1 Tax=Solanum bulbocastanum TaxID=147425 RepID=A0AAN8YSQ5_SOLBU